MIFWENVTFHKNLFTMLWSQDENESIVVWCHFHTPQPHVSYKILTENLITKLNEVKWLINYFCFTIILMNRIGHWTKTQDAKSNCPPSACLTNIFSCLLWLEYLVYGTLSTIVWIVCCRDHVCSPGTGGTCHQIPEQWTVQGVHCPVQSGQ